MQIWKKLNITVKNFWKTVIDGIKKLESSQFRGASNYTPALQKWVMITKSCRWCWFFFTQIFNSTIHFRKFCNHPVFEQYISKGKTMCENSIWHVLDIYKTYVLVKKDVHILILKILLNWKNPRSWIHSELRNNVKYAKFIKFISKSIFSENAKNKLKRWNLILFLCDANGSSHWEGMHLRQVYRSNFFFSRSSTKSKCR